MSRSYYYISFFEAQGVSLTCVLALALDIHCLAELQGELFLNCITHVTNRHTDDGTITRFARYITFMLCML